MRKESSHGFVEVAETGDRRPDPRALTNVHAGYSEGKCGVWAAAKRLRDLCNTLILHGIFHSCFSSSSYFLCLERKKKRMTGNLMCITQVLLRDGICRKVSLWLGLGIQDSYLNPRQFPTTRTIDSCTRSRQHILLCGYFLVSVTLRFSGGLFHNPSIPVPLAPGIVLIKTRSNDSNEVIIVNEGCNQNNKYTCAAFYR